MTLPALSRAELGRSFRWEVPELFNIAEATVERSARHHPDRIALVEPDRQSTFAQVRQLSNRFANALQAVGVQKGDRVGLLMGQSLELALAHMAVYKLGAITLPLSILFGLDAFEYRLEHSRASFLIAERGVLEALQANLSPGVKTIYSDEVLPLAAGASAQFSGPATRADDPAILIYTSGTTGKPKGALLPHRTLIGHLPSYRLFSNFPGDEAVYWSPADWAWAGGLLNVLLPSWANGYTVVAYRAKRFDPGEALHLMQHHRVSHTFLFPTALKLLRQAGPVRHQLDLKSIHSGGEAVGAELLAWVEENLGQPVNEFYGQTEANLIVGNSYTVDPVRPGSMGLPYPGHRVEVIDEAGNPLPPGEVGEIALYSPSSAPDPVAFLGYWQNPQASHNKFVGPYLKTGDLALKDPDGYLWFKARSDDMIKAAGYRISPFEIEEALVRHPAVAMVAVVGLPDPQRGERIVAHVKLREGHTPSEGLIQALQDEARRRVGKHAYPREIHFVEELPLTTTGKIQRFKLRLGTG